MKKSLLWIVVMMLSISLVAVFSFVGCKTTTTTEETTAAAAETTAAAAETTAAAAGTTAAAAETTAASANKIYITGTEEWKPGFALAPRVKDYLTAERMSPLILDRGTLPDGYMFPNDWVKSQDWDAIKKEYGGTTLDIIFEGTDIGAPNMTKDQFESLSGIKLNFTGMPIAVQMQKLMVSFASGSASFDVTVVNTSNLPVFVKFVEPLDDLIKKWNYDVDDYFPHFQSLMTDTPLVAGGKIYGIPNDYDQHYWHSQKKYLDQIGKSTPPQTWEEVLTYCEELKKILPEGVYPIGFMMSRDLFTWESFWDIAASFGANYFKPGTWEPDMASPEAIAAANFMRDLIVKGYLHPGSTSWDYAKQLEAWNAGNLAMCIQYPIQESYNPQWSKVANEETYNSVLPKGIGANARIATHGTSTNVALCLNKQSTKKDAAFLWMAFENSSEVQYITTATGTGIDYGRKSIFATEIANTFYPNAQASFESIPYIYNDIQIAPGPEIMEVMVPAIHDVFTGTGKAEDILPAANEKVREIMVKYGYIGDTPPVPAPQSFWNWDLYPEYQNYKWVDGVGTGW